MLKNLKKTVQMSSRQDVDKIMEEVQLANDEFQQVLEIGHTVLGADEMNSQRDWSLMICLRERM
jgi:hypothetical protein